MNAAANKKSSKNDLFDLEHLAKTLSFDEQNTLPADEKYIVFLTSQDFYAVATKQITEIIRPIDVAPLPNVPAWISGIANLRGEIIPVIDLQKLFSKKDSGVPKSKFIVLRPENSLASIAFAVDALSEIVTVSDAEINLATDELSPCVYGTTVYKSNVLRFIDVKNLLTSLSIN